MEQDEFDVRIPGFVDATATLIAGPFAWRKRSPFVQGASHVRLAPETFTSYPAPTGEVAVGMLLSRNDTNYHRQIPMITGLSARLSEAFGKFTTGVATRRRGAWDAGDNAHNTGLPDRSGRLSRRCSSSPFFSRHRRPAGFR
jgi:hypothetical protein